MSSEVDIPVTVNFQFTDPAGSPLTTTTPSMSGSTYTSTAMVSSFGRDQSGNYTCMVVIDSAANSFLIDSDSQFDTIRITVGKSVAMWNVTVNNYSACNASYICVIAIKSK